MPATLQTKRPRPAARHTWQLLGSQYSLSGWVGLLFMVPSLLSAVLLIQREGHGQLWQDLLFIIIIWAAPVVFLLFCRLTVLPVKPRKSRPGLTLLAFLLAGAVRGLVIFSLQPIFRFTPWGDPIIRMISEVITIAAALSVIAIEVSARLSYRDALAQLAFDREDLLQLQMGAAAQFHDQREALLTEAQGILNPILESLKGSLRSARDAQTLSLLSRKMREVVDDTVRPLSASIAQRSPSIERRGRLVPHAKTPKLQSADHIELGRFILPFTITVFIAIMNVGPLIIIGGWAAAVQALEIMIVGLYASLWLLRVATLKWKVSSGWGTVIYTLAHVVAGAVTIAILYAAQIDFPSVLLIGWLVLLAGVSILLFRYQYVEWVRSSVIETQAEVNEELDVVLSSLRQQVRVESRRIATILHGPVQTALYAAAIRMTAQREVDLSLADAVMRDLETAMSRLESEPIAPPTLEEFIAEMRSVWGASIEIDFRQDAAIEELLGENPTALACVTEVVREGVNNAIKHANASRVAIEVLETESPLIAVTIANEGTLESSDSPSGFGADVLNDLTHEWSLTDDGQSTTLWATVALDHVD